MRQKILRQDRLLIGGTNSGCGKTTITCALLSLLRKKGASVSSFKCGPDYIDPMFHEKAIGVQSANLDAFFCDDNTLLSLLAENSAGTSLSVIEGVMGYYDGMSLSSEKASAYDLARITGTPAILCVNCKGMANSAVALVKGFAEYRPDSMVKGIILNNI